MNKPTDSVRIVLFDPDNHDRFLVLAEVDDPDNWKLPGGKFDSVDESPDTAAARELGEELQVSADKVQLAQAGTLTNDDGESARYIYVGFASVDSVQPSDEIASVRWVSEDNVPDSPNKHHMLSAVSLARSSHANQT
jgi:ADP-ribose pyrophosphatase YjhB (NUDIX family)